LVRHFVDHVLSVDTTLLRTFTALVRRPGSFISEFLLGRRVGYARPFPYYLLVVAMNIAVGAVLPDAGGTQDANDDGSFWDRNFVALQIGLTFGMLMLPVAAVRRMLHAKAGYSVVEHFCFLLYILAQSILIVLVAHLAFSVAGVPFDSDVEGSIWLAAFLGYAVLASPGFLDEPRWKVGLKLVAALVAALIGMGAILAIVQAFRGAI
jgi:hypothetical protein